MLNVLVMISFDVKNVKMPEADFAKIEIWLNEVAASHDRRIGNLNYLFCDDEEILKVNREFLHHDYYTDIITFDYCDDEAQMGHPDTISGDLFISLDTVRSNAEQQGTTYDEELHRVIIHGVLHLVGINDKAQGEREIMEAAENKALAMRTI